jgi:predicted Zn-dependent peptidase
VRPLDGAPVAAIALWYRASSSGFDATKPGIGRLAATAIAASQPITGTPLGTFVNRLGGRMSIGAYPESVSVSILVPADKAALALRALSRSFFSPVLTEAGLTAARRTLAEESAIRAIGSEGKLDDALYAALFAGGPAKAPPFPAPGAIDGWNLGDVKAYAERAFRPGNAVLVFTGSVSPDLTSAVMRGREDALPGPESPQPDPLAAASPVALVGNEPGFGRAWAGPPIADEAAATAFDFLADRLFGPGSPVQTAATAAGTTLDGTFVTYHDPGVFLVTASGGNVAAVRAAVEAAVARAQEPMAADAFETARRQFVFRLLSHAATPDLIADNYGWYTVEGAPPYTPGEGGNAGRYLQAVAALTPASVAAAAARYLAAPGAVVVMGTPAPPAPPSRT